MALGSLSSSPDTKTYKYDVFLSFRGEDTRYGFTSHLYQALQRKGISTFMDDDDDGLRKGEDIPPSILNAIQNSRLAIVVLSNKCTSFCLDELVQILDCQTRERMQILPVFYKVEPSELRHRKMRYGEELAKLEQGRFRDDKEKVQRWKLALQQVANLSGFHFKHGEQYEHEFISDIIKVVCSKLDQHFFYVAKHPVGLEARIQDVQSLIGDKRNSKVIGIYGIGGLGKTTLASALYNSMAYQFEGSCFLANVREKSTMHGLGHIQQTMLSELVGERNIKLGDMYQGIQILKERLHQKKVLLILDDVDQRKQLEATAGRFDWFGSGSIIIITTRDKHLLDIHGVEKLYEVKRFNDTDALELLRLNAFQKKAVDPSYFEIIKRAIYYANGLPLALETIGSNLFGKTLDECESALEAYERIPDRNVQEILRVSYDGLKENEKEIFLDIACFFNRCTLRYVIDMLNGRGFHAKYGIGVLKEKSIINIWRSVKCDDYIVTMHSLIQSMGKELVWRQSTRTEKRNRLWFHEDVIHVLEKNQANDKIEAIMLDVPKDKAVQWNEKVFGKMENLRMLIKKKDCYLGSPKHLPNSLRVLEWWGYPATSLPPNVHSKNLIILNLSHGFFQWDTPLEESKVLSQLIFRGCKNIRQIPDVSGFPNLTELCVDYCTNLIEIHDSVGFLDKLQRFSSKGCTKLSVVPHRIKLKSLEYLCLRDCSSIDTFPEILGPMGNLVSVDLEGTAVKNLPLSIQNVQGPRMLSLNRCKILEDNALSNIIHMSQNLHFLLHLELREPNLTNLLMCIEECYFLKRPNLSTSKWLQEIRVLPPSVTGLPPITGFAAKSSTSLKGCCSALNTLLESQIIGSSESWFCILPGVSIPKCFDLSRSGNSIRFWFRKKFPSLVLCAIVGVLDDFGLPFHMNFDFHLKINDIEETIPYRITPIVNTDHLFILNCDLKWMPTERVRLGHEWNYGEVLFVSVKRPDSDSCRSGSIKGTGIYVNKIFTRMEDIQFTNPFLPESTCDGSSYSNRTLLCEAPDIPDQQQQQKSVLNDLFSNADSPEPTWNIDSSNDLDEVFVDNQAEVPGESSHTRSCVNMQNIQVQSLTSSSGQVNLEPNLGTSSIMLPTMVDASLRDQIELIQDDDVEMEAFYASFDAETHFHDKLATTAPSEEAKKALKIVQDFFSNDASVLLHPEWCRVMERSLEHLSNLSAYDGISTELRMLISEASIMFIHWRRDYNAANMKIESATPELQRADELETSLQGNMKKFSEVVAFESELLDNLARMEGSKNLTLKRKSDIFEEGKAPKTLTDALRERAPHLHHEHGLAKENELLDNLAPMEERIKELDEEINVIESEMSASQSERNMTLKRKREIYEEGKMLKTQMDELRKKTQEHSSAKVTQTIIKSEWSEMREKFQKIAAE